MHKRFSKSNLIRFLGHEATSEEVMHSHAFKKVEKENGPSIRPRHPYSSDKKTVSSYRDSMVGSVAQYHDNTPIQAKKLEIEKSEAKDHGNIIGNRPSSSAQEPSKNDQSSVERRHHFIEPPKPNFNGSD